MTRPAVDTRAQDSDGSPAPWDKPVPLLGHRLGYTGQDEYRAGSAGRLLDVIRVAEKLAALEGQDILPFWNASPLNGVVVNLCRCADGTLALQITGLSS